MGLNRLNLVEERIYEFEERFEKNRDMEKWKRYLEVEG